MELETFFEQFELLADAPNGAQKLRQLILQLAVQGKLVPQDPNDEPAEVLLERIEAQKKRLFKEKKIQKPRKYTKIHENEIPYELPQNWQWVRLCEVGHDWGQKKPDVAFTYIDVSAIDKKKGVIGDKLNIIQPDEAPSRARKIVAKGTVIYSTVRPYLLNIAIVDREFELEPIVSTAFAVIHPFEGISNKYLYYYLRSQPFIDYVESQMMGMAYPAINDGNLYKGLIPLPPLPEQKRIVAKVDRLMSLCDELQARQEKRRDRILQLGKVATSQLLTPSTPEAFNQHWQGICDNFDLLYSTPENVSQLRQAILQLAVMGKLVPQNPDDEPASVLLEKVEAEKRHLIEEKKLRERWSPVPVSPDAIPYKIPMNWKWIRILDGVERVTVGHVGSMKNEYVLEGVPFLRSQNVRENRFDPLGLKFISPEFHDKLAKSKLSPGDVVVVRSGNVGTTCVIPEALEDANCSDLVIVKRPMAIDSSFLSYYMNSAAKSHVKEGSVGMALTHFNTESVASLPIPLPPLPEQHRIVTKVDRLMSLCDELEAKLTQFINNREKLMETAVRQVLAA